MRGSRRRTSTRPADARRAPLRDSGADRRRRDARCAAGSFAPPPRTGTLSARLLSDPRLAPGVRISLLPGEAGSFFLESVSEQPVTVLGRDGEPFVRLSPGGVEANLHSATFAEVARLRGGTSLALEPRADVPPRWQRVSTAPSYGWVDLRTAYAEARSPRRCRRPASPPSCCAGPCRCGSAPPRMRRVVRVEGVTEWKPFPAKPAKPSH